MNLSIPSNPLTPSQLANWTNISQQTSPGQPVDFQKLLFDSLQQVSDLGHTAESNIEARLLGENITSAEVYTSMRKADLALKMVMQVRNKLVSAYQEVQQMRM